MSHAKPAPDELSVPARERIQAAALQLFTQRGYAATSVREIVKAAGVTKPILYYYFGSKESLYLEILNKVLRDFEALLEGLHQDRGSARERILWLADEVYRMYCNNLEIARLVHAIYFGPPQGAPPFDFEVFNEKFNDAVLRVVQYGIEAGEFRRGDPQITAWAIIGAINAANEMEFSHKGPRMGREGLAKVLECVFSGIGSLYDERKKS